MGFGIAAAAIGIGLTAAGQAGAFASAPGVPRASGIVGAADKLSTTSETDFIKYLQQFYPQLVTQAQGINQGANQFGLQQQNQFGTNVGQSFQNTAMALDPQFFQGQHQLGQELFGSPLGLSPQQVSFFNNQLMGNQAAMGLGSSPLGTQNTALALTGLNLQQANTQLGQQQNFLNDYFHSPVPNIFGPTAAAGQTNAATLGGNTLQGISPAELLNLQANLAGLKFAQQTQQANAINGAIAGVGSSITGMAMGGGGGGMSSFFGGGASGAGMSGFGMSGQAGTLGGGGFAFA